MSDERQPSDDDDERRKRRLIVGPPPRPFADAPPPKPASKQAPAVPVGPSLGERLRASPVSIAILVANFAWFLWAEHHGSTQSVPILLRFGAIESMHVWVGEYWRLATHMFLHIGWVHILWNTYGGFSLCVDVEKALGRWRFLVTYLLSGFVGGCASVLTAYPTSAGASGAMFGMIGAMLALRLRSHGSLASFAKDPSTRSTLIQAGIWLLIGTQVNFNNRAHFGGLVGGALVTLAFTSKRARVFFPLVCVLVAGLFVAAVRPWWKPNGKEVAALRTWSALYASGREGIAVDPARAKRFLDRACAADATACGAPTLEEPADAP